MIEGKALQMKAMQWTAESQLCLIGFKSCLLLFVEASKHAKGDGTRGLVVAAALEALPHS